MVRQLGNMCESRMTKLFREKCTQLLPLQSLLFNPVKPSGAPSQDVSAENLSGAQESSANKKKTC